MNKALLIVCTGLVAGAAGCVRPPQPVDPTALQVPLADEAGFDQLWTSAQEILREHRFALDRVDERNGVITTLPVTSQAFFEFWRHDVNTPFDLMEATLRTVRRRVEVQVDRLPEEPSASVVVTVYRQTFARPERQFNSSSAALQVFGSRLPGVRGEPYLTTADDYWIDDGRDGAMETLLAGRIVERASIVPLPPSAKEEFETPPTAVN